MESKLRSGFMNFSEENKTVNYSNVPPNSTTNQTSQEENFKEVVFQYCVTFAGIVGAIANAAVLMIFLTQTKMTKLSTSTKFVINQLSIDFCSCFSLIMTYGWKIVNRNLNRNWNYWSCYLIQCEILEWCCINASATNLILITLERYLKIVYTSIHERFNRNWMAYVLMSSSWLLGFIVQATSVVSLDFHYEGSSVICEMYTQWSSAYVGLFFGMSQTVFNYVDPMLVFIVCYWHILVVFRRSASFFDNTNSGVNQMHHKNEVALIKTMIIITAVFGICWSPNDIFFVLICSDAGSSDELSMTSTTWYVTLFLGYLTCAVHPFIYGARDKIVRNFINRKWKKNKNGESSSGQSPETISTVQTTL